MTTTPPQEPAPARWKPLDAPQRRVLGVLIEKAKTTPSSYPMTVNAITAGCNQKNNRDPVTAYDDFDVEKALSELQVLGVVKEIDWVGRVPKYKHVVYEWLDVRPVELAVLAELLLRGSQTLGELRARAARMEPIEDLAALKPIVQGLVERKLMIELTSPGRGQLVSHNLYPSGELATLRAQHGRHAGQGDPGAGERFSPRSPSSVPRLRGWWRESSDSRPDPVDLRATVARIGALVGSHLTSRFAASSLLLGRLRHSRGPRRAATSPYLGSPRGTHERSPHCRDATDSPRIRSPGDDPGPCRDS